MYSMAYIAVIKRDCMNEGGIFMPREGVIMAVPAENDLAAFQQLFSVAGMGAVAISTAVPLGFSQMTVDAEQFLGNFLMTAQAGFLTDPAAAAIMTIITPLFKRLMQDITNHCLPVTAMGIVT